MTEEELSRALVQDRGQRKVNRNSGRGGHCTSDDTALRFPTTEDTGDCSDTSVKERKPLVVDPLLRMVEEQHVIPIQESNSSLTEDEPDKNCRCILKARSSVQKAKQWQDFRVSLHSKELHLVSPGQQADLLMKNADCQAIDKKISLLRATGRSEEEDTAERNQFWFTLLYALVYLVHGASVLGNHKKNKRGTTKATKAKVLQGDGHLLWLPTTARVLARSKSKMHIEQDCNYDSKQPVTLASFIAAKNVQEQSEVQESNFPTCLLCGTKGHDACNCRRWLDPEPDPEPPGTTETIRISVFYEPSIE